MFLSDADVRTMTGIDPAIHRPVKLKNWLEGRGYVENQTFFRRADGWYSVMQPQARTAVVPARPQVRRRA